MALKFQYIVVKVATVVNFYFEKCPYFEYFLHDGFMSINIFQSPIKYMYNIYICIIYVHVFRPVYIPYTAVIFTTLFYIVF